MSHRSHHSQRGGSLMGNIFLLALFVYAVYLAIQYVPQYLESRSLDSVLQSLQSQHQSNPFESAQEVDQALRRNLNMNQMDDMMRHIQVRQNPSGFSIEASYERELDLVFQKKTLTVNKTVDLQ